MVNHGGPSDPLKDFTYMLNATDKPDLGEIGWGTESYTLDPLNRLTNMTTNGERVSYTYDAARNRLSETVNGAMTTTAMAQRAISPRLELGRSRHTLLDTF